MDGVRGFESELKAGIITSAAERACPLWYGQKKHSMMLAHGSERFSFGTREFAFPKNLPHVPKSRVFTQQR